MNGSRVGKHLVLSELDEVEKKYGVVIYQFASDLQDFAFNPGTSYYYARNVYGQNEF